MKDGATCHVSHSAAPADLNYIIWGSKSFLLSVILSRCCEGQHSLCPVFNLGKWCVKRSSQSPTFINRLQTVCSWDSGVMQYTGWRQFFVHSKQIYLVFGHRHSIFGFFKVPFWSFIYTFNQHLTYRINSSVYLLVLMHCSYLCCVKNNINCNITNAIYPPIPCITF